MLEAVPQRAIEADADRQEWALRSFLRAMELLQNARVSVGDAADAAEGVLSAALE
jgi:hypothetical protein